VLLAQAEPFATAALIMKDSMRQTLNTTSVFIISAGNTPHHP
jgi:hypothetical protein